MIYPLRMLDITVACLGNHDLDFDENTVTNLISQTNFPWLLSNVIDLRTGKNFVNCQDYYIINKNNIKIGVIGLAEEEWLGLITEID